MVTEFILTFVVFPKDLNPSVGTLFGGKLLAEMDTCAGTLCKRLLRKSECNAFVTAKIKSVLFNKPAFLGDIITVHGKLSALDETGADVYILVTKEIANGPDKGQTVKIASGVFQMVSIKDGKRHPHGVKT